LEPAKRNVSIGRLDDDRSALSSHDA
jgi:hypothetical protein